MPSYAQQYRTFFYNLMKYGFSFSKEELKQIVITVVMVGFVWSFNDWGDDKFDIFAGLLNLFVGMLFALIATVFNQIGQRVVAVYYGYDPVYEGSMLGIMIALVVAFASRGFLIFFMPGAINIRHLTASRLGEFRYYTNDWEWAKAGFMGPFLNVLLVVILSPFKANTYVMQLMIMNILFAVYSFIPLPQNLGLYLFYPHVHFWTFTVGITAGMASMSFFLPPVFSILIGVFVGIYAMYWHFVKKDGWLDMPWEGGHH